MNSGEQAVVAIETEMANGRRFGVYNVACWISSRERAEAKRLDELCLLGVGREDLLHQLRALSQAHVMLARFAEAVGRQVKAAMHGRLDSTLRRAAWRARCEAVHACTAADPDATSTSPQESI